MSKKLTHEFIAMRTKCDRLESIVNLNLWGNDLEDISILRTMHRLEVVSLSVNKIRSLKDFANLKNLRELYLRKNSISDINEIKYLSDLPELKILWLSENPIAEIKGYREIVIKNLPQIIKLDDHAISIEERDACDYEQPYKDNHSSQDEEQQFEVGKSEDNVFENQNFTHDNQDKNYQPSNNINSNNNNEIYSNNEKNRKLKDKFNYQNQNNNPSGEIRKKFSVNYEDSSNIAQNFENLNIKKRNTTANTNNYNNAVLESKFENKNENQNILQKNPSQNRQQINNDNFSGQNIKNAPSRVGNILNCVLMLLRELNDNELEIIKSEVDKKLARY